MPAYLGEPEKREAFYKQYTLRPVRSDNDDKYVEKRHKRPLYKRMKSEHIETEGDEITVLEKVKQNGSNRFLFGR